LPITATRGATKSVSSTTALNPSTAGCISGLEKKTAVRYSFLIAIPAILGAVVLDFSSISEIPFNAGVASGFAAAFISGYAALKLLFWLSATRHYLWFAFYTLVLGLLTLCIGQ
jgi:undecaprenyl-diphosphatase